MLEVVRNSQQNMYKNRYILKLILVEGDQFLGKKKTEKPFFVHASCSILFCMTSTVMKYRYRSSGSSRSETGG